MAHGNARVPEFSHKTGSLAAQNWFARESFSTIIVCCAIVVIITAPSNRCLALSSAASSQMLYFVLVDLSTAIASANERVKKLWGSI